MDAIVPTPRPIAPSTRPRPIPTPGPPVYTAMAPDRIERSQRDSLGLQLQHGAGAVYDFLLGDDFRKTFGADETLGERAIGAASLASDFVPIGKIAGLGIKAATHVAVGIGTRASVHAAIDVATHVAEDAAKLAQRERTRLAAIASGEHTIAEVDGKRLAHPSQDLEKIESLIQRSSAPRRIFSCRKGRLVYRITFARTLEA